MWSEVPQTDGLYHCVVPLLQENSITYQEVKRLYELHHPPIGQSEITEKVLENLANLFPFDLQLLHRTTRSDGSIEKVRPWVEPCDVPENFERASLLKDLCQDRNILFTLREFFDDSPIEEQREYKLEIFFVRFYQRDWVVVFRQHGSATFKCAYYDPLNRRNTKCFVEDIFFEGGQTLMHLKEVREIEEDETFEEVFSFTCKFLRNFLTSESQSFSDALFKSQFQLDELTNNNLSDLKKIYSIGEILAKLPLIERDMKVGLIGLDVPIKLSLLALLCGEHVLLLGPPGVAKSEIAKRLLSIISDKHKSMFSFLMTKFTQPDELLGPISVNELKRDKFIRVTKQYLPEAYIAFLDEIFKTSASLVNSLLTIMFERKFDNGGERHDINLRTVICASNERPRDSTYRAFYDRILFRYWVNYLVEKSELSQLLQLKKLKRHEPIKEMTRISLEELEALTNYAIDHIEDKFNFVTELYLIEFLEQLQTKDRFLNVSDRRKLQIKHALEMVALTRGSFTEYLCLSDLWILKYCVPVEISNDDKTQIQIVEQILLSIFQKYLSKDPVHPAGTFLQNVGIHFWIQNKEKNENIIKHLKISYIPFDFVLEAKSCDKVHGTITMACKNTYLSANAVEIVPHQQYEVEWDIDLDFLHAYLSFACFDDQYNEINPVQVSRVSDSFLTVSEFNPQLKTIKFNGKIVTHNEIWKNLKIYNYALAFYTHSNFDQIPNFILQPFENLKANFEIDNAAGSIQICSSNVKLVESIFAMLQSNQTIYIMQHQISMQYVDCPIGKCIIEGIETRFVSSKPCIKNGVGKVKLLKGTKFLKMRLNLQYSNKDVQVRLCRIKPLGNILASNMITNDTGICYFINNQVKMNQKT